MDVLKGKRILVIDDAEAERMLISTYLQQYGCRLYHAHDGIDGINKARLLVPDLILMDADMPQCDGYTACKALKGEPVTADVPVIFLSAYATPEKRVQGLLAGAVDYIGKPFDFDEVKLRLGIHMNNRGKRDTDTLAAEAVSAVELPEEGKAESSEANLYRVLFHTVRVHLLRSLDDVPGIQELARLAGTNSKRLNAAFKHCVGMTVFEYLREERMKEACQLLRNTRLSISEIACRVGFSSSANFATAFKERYGLTPSAFRQTPPSY